MPPSPAGDRLSSEDAMFLYLEKKEMPLHIGSVSIFDGTISLDSLTALVESKLPLIPRYRQRIVTAPFNLGHPTWAYDPAFDIRRHMRAVSLKNGSDEDVQAVAGEILAEVMDRERPLWDMTLIGGLKRGHTAVIARLHHCLADGTAGVALFNVLMETTRTVAPLPRKQSFHAPPLPDPATSLTDALLSSATQMMESMLLAEAAAAGLAQSLVTNDARRSFEKWLSFVPDLMTSLDRLPFNAPVKGPRQHLWTEMSIPEIAAIRTVLGGTLNDVVLTVVTSAVRRYAELHGQPVAGRLLRFWVPVNLRAPGEQPGTGNRISILPVLTPLGIRDPIQLLLAVHTATAAMKRSHILDLVNLAAAWMSATPPPFQALFGRLGNVIPVPPFHLVCTNVPGPKTPVYLLGKKMLRTYPYVPIGNDMGFCCAVQSYNGRLYAGLTADSAVVPDARKIRSFIDEAYRELREAAGVKPSEKPKPRARRAPVPATAPGRSDGEQAPAAPPAEPAMVS